MAFDKGGEPVQFYQQENFIYILIPLTHKKESEMKSLTVLWHKNSNKQQT